MDESQVRAIVRNELNGFTHTCIQAQMIGRVQALQEQVLKEVFGNGHEGMSKTIPKLIEQVNTLDRSVRDLRTAVSGFTIFEAEIKGAENHGEKLFDKGHKKTTKNLQIAGVVVSIIIVLTSIYFGFRNINKKFDTIEREVRSQSVMMIEERGFGSNSTRGIDSTYKNNK